MINHMTPKQFEDSMESENQTCPKLTRVDQAHKSHKNQ